MINNNLNTSGIQRAYILAYGSDIRIYIPTLFNDTTNCPITDINTLDVDKFLKNKDAYPIPLWCAPNLEVMQYDEVHPCWVIFENGDINRPIIMGFLGKGIKYHATNIIIQTGDSENEETNGENSKDLEAQRQELLDAVANGEISDTEFRDRWYALEQEATTQTNIAISEKPLGVSPDTAFRDAYYAAENESYINTGSFSYSTYNVDSVAMNNWLANAPNSYAREHGSGTGTQCVELSNDYVQTITGVSNWGGFGDGGRQYIGITNAHPDYFTRIDYTPGTTVKVGDILSLRGSQTQYGHAVVVTGVSGNNITIVEQWNGSGRVRTSTFTYTTGGKRTIIGIARPK